MNRRATCFAAVLVLVAVSLCGVSGAAAQAGAGLFELGDAAGLPGSADIRGGEASGPDWDDLFTADGYRKDADGDGVLDFLQFPGGQAAVFMADDVSLGAAVDTTALSPEGLVRRAAVARQHDLGNAYVFTALDASGALFLFAGAERLDGGEGSVEFEFSQDHLRLGHGAPWTVTGEFTDADVVVRLEFQQGGLAQTTVLVLQDGVWTASLSLAGEGCDLDGTLCVYANVAEVESGAWGLDASAVPAGRFVEFGIDLSKVAGPVPSYQTVQVRTPEDIVFGYFAEGN